MLNNLHVPVWQWAISQVFALCALGLICFAYSIKRKRTVLFAIGSGCLLNAIVNIILLNWVVVCIMLVAATTNFVMSYFEFRREKGKTVNKYASFVITLCLAVAMAIAICSVADWWFDYVLLVSSLCITVSSWLRGIHLHRFTCFAYDSLAIVNCWVYSNYIGIIMSIISIIAVVVFYARFLKKH